MTPPLPLDPAAAFHAHLDACALCRDRPFDLCPTGLVLLSAVPLDGATVTASCLCDEIDPSDRPCIVCEASAFLAGRDPAAAT